MLCCHSSMFETCSLCTVTAGPDAATQPDDLPLPLEYLAAHRELLLAYKLLEADNSLKVGPHLMACAACQAGNGGSLAANCQHNACVTAADTIAFVSASTTPLALQQGCVLQAFACHQLSGMSATNGETMLWLTCLLVLDTATSALAAALCLC